MIRDAKLRLSEDFSLRLQKYTLPNLTLRVLNYRLSISGRKQTQIFQSKSVPTSNKDIQGLSTLNPLYFMSLAYCVLFIYFFYFIKYVMISNVILKKTALLINFISFNPISLQAQMFYLNMALFKFLSV